MDGHAGTSRLTPTDADDSDEDEITDTPTESTTDEADTAGGSESDDETSDEPDDNDSEADDAEESPEGSPSRLSRAWFVAAALMLLILTAGVATGGYLAFRSHGKNADTMQDETAAVAAAKDCVSATNAPDPQAMANSVQKIIDCSTGDFGAYAKMMAPMMVEAYQAANVKVEVTTMRAAAERVNDDGTVDVLVAFRFRVPSNPDSQGAETGLRLRATMAHEDGQFKIAKLEPVMAT